MKAKIFFIAFALLFAFWSQAKHVTVENAQSVAQKYFSQTTGGVTLRSARASSYTLAYTAKKETGGVNLRSAQTGDEDAYFYIFNTPDGDGFIIVSADDRAYPVLGYSLNGAFDYDKAPPVFVQWLMGYQDEIEKGLNANPKLATNPEWKKIGDGIKLSSTEVTLNTAKWNQGNPYNLQCPVLNWQHTATGCVATAMAIVIKHHADNGFAATGTGSHSYTWQGETLTADFGAYDWSNMPNNSIDYINDTQRNAVARLMSHCGISVESQYGVGGTSAYTPNIAKALVQFFGFDKSTQNVSKIYFGEDEWKNIIRAEIDNNCPIIYMGGNHETLTSHAFVCEGYNENDEYAMNWGWGGSYNGFFRLNPLQPYPSPNYNFSDGQCMIIGMKKESGNITDSNQIWLTSTEGGTGMSKSVADIIQNQPFTIMARALENTSYNAFRGMVSVALTDMSGNIKEIIATPVDRANNPLNPNYCLPTEQSEFSCIFTVPYAPYDMIRMVSSTDNGGKWTIINGKTGVIDKLGLQYLYVTDVTLNSYAETLNVGETFQLTATIIPEDATDKNVIWSSSNTNIAEVDSFGLVKAKMMGEATITATVNQRNGSRRATCTVTITSIPNYRASGITGPLTWTLDYDGVLTLSGSGAMPNYQYDGAPWYNLRSFFSSLVIGDKVTSIGDVAFAGCSGFTGNLIIPNSVTSIGDNAFYFCSGFSGSLTIPNSVTSIGRSAFAGCSGFTGNLTIPNSVISIGGNAFERCSGFTGNLTIPNSVTSIEENTFMYCNHFNGTLTIPNSVTSIGESAFYYCSGFTGTLTIPNSVTSIGDNAFSGCGGFSSNLTIPNSVTSIGSGAFYDCSGFSGSLTIPNSVTSIGSGAFSSCSGFSESLTISNSVTSIGEYAFASSSGFTDIVVGWTTPLSVVNTFYLVNLSTKTLHVPAGTEALYQAASVWKDFGTIVEDIQPVTSVTLNSNSETLNVGGSFQLTASVDPANATNKNVTWMSSDANVANVSSSGLVTAQSAGTATITVTTADGGKTATCTITVQFTTISVTGVTLNSNAETLTVGGTFQLIHTITPDNATNKNVTWTSSDVNIVEVSASGLVTAKATGTATITVTTADGDKTTTCAITVQTVTVPVTGVSLNSTSQTLTEGGSFQLSATVTPANATNKNVTWSSSNSSVASVNSAGMVTAIAAGSAMITVTTADGNKTATCSITVQAAIISVTGVTLNSNAETLTEGGTFQLSSTITPTNATNKNVSWSSSNSSVASVNSAGIVTAIAAGSAMITVTTVDGNKTATCSITVQAAIVNVTGVTLNSNAETLTEGGTFQLMPTITPVNATNQNVSWSSSNPSIASVNSSGFVTANTAGSATIIVTTSDGNKTASCAITVTSTYRASGTTGPLTWTLDYNGTLTISGSGAMPNYGVAPWYNMRSYISSLVIEGNVTSIGDFAFYHCSDISGTLTIPNSVTSIGEHAFTLCSGFTGNLIIPNSVTSIGENAFVSCSGFNGNLTISNSLTLIKENVFAYCSGFTGNLTIPNSVTSIGESAFALCSGFTGLTIGNSVTSIEFDAFALCSGFTGDLTIPNSVTTIAMQAFRNCSGFTGLTIGNSVATIGDGAFYLCTGFTGILTIPNSVTSIGEYVFDYCSGLTDIVVRWTTPLYVVNTFYGVNATLHVPIGTKALYEVAQVWKDFDPIVEDAHLFSAPYEGVTGYENLSAGSTKAWLQGNILHVTSPVEEKITLFSLSGSILYQSKKHTGVATFKVGDLPRGILIVRGSSGWTQKIIRN